MFGVHWIPTHRGNLGSTTDREIISRWQPGMVKIVCIDERPPYLEDVPPNALIIIRNHPMSEDGNRGQGDAPMSKPKVVVPVYNPDDPFEIVGWELGEEDDDAPAEYVHPAGHVDQYNANTRRAPLYDLPTTVTAQVGYEALYGETPANETPYQRGQRHAAICNRMAQYCESKGIARSRLRFEGLNELQLWADEPPAWSAQYYLGFLVGLHSYGLLGVVGNLGVGWPGNGGVADAPPNWDWFKPVIDAMQPGDYLGLHEYWALNGPQQNWRWWGGRFLQCPFNVPIVITECGIDTGVTGQWYGGWRDLLGGGTENQKAVSYSNELVWYAQQCRNDGRVKQVFPFTYDIGSSHWEKFDIRSWAFLDAFFAVKDTVTNPPPVVQPPPVVTPPPDVELLVRQAVWDAAEIDYNPEAALARYARANGLGNPVTQETDTEGYRAQGFAKKIVYCRVGQWDHVSELDW